MHEDGCIVTRALPKHDIHHIYTGQAVRVEELNGKVTWKGPVWTGSYTFEGAPDPAARIGGSPYPQVEATVSSPATVLFAARCVDCHNLVPEHNVGPPLVGVVGRQAGDTAGFSFTAALSALDIVWTQESLAEFIVDPAKIRACNHNGRCRFNGRESAAHFRESFCE